MAVVVCRCGVVQVAGAGGGAVVAGRWCAWQVRCRQVRGGRWRWHRQRQAVEAGGRQVVAGSVAGGRQGRQVVRAGVQQQVVVVGPPLGHWRWWQVVAGSVAGTQARCRCVVVPLCE